MRSQVVIENPVLNSAYAEPTRHFRFDEEGITDKIDEFRRPSAYFVPVPQPRKRGKQMVLDTQWTKDRVEENKLVCDTELWEQKMAQAPEDMKEVVCYAKNQNLGFEIPYTIDGDERWYRPDFLVRYEIPSPSRGEGKGEGEIINLIVEVSGEPRRDKAAKVATARDLWIPAVKNDGRFGRWAFIEVTDPWDAKNTIRAALRLQTAIAQEV